MIKYALSVKQALLFTDLSLIGCKDKYFKRTLDIDYIFPECLIRGDGILWNYDNDIAFDEAILKNRTLNEAVKYFNTSLEKTTEDLEKVTSKIIKSKKFNSQNKKDLEFLFNQYIEAYLLNMPFLFHFWNIENLIISQLKQDFKNIFGEKSSEEKLQQVLTPSKETYFSKERKSLEKIAIYLSKKPNGEKLENMIKEHLNKFAFTSFVLMLGKPHNEEDILNRVKELLKEDLKKKVSNRQRKERRDRGEINKILKRLHSQKDVYKRVLLAQELMFWKNQRLDILFKCDLEVKTLFGLVAALMELSYEELVYLRYEELKLWFKSGKLPSKQEIGKRMESYALHLKNGKIFLYTDKSKYPQIEVDSKKEAISESNRIIEGKIAYKGRVKGKVRIVNSVDDAKSVRRGEVLVTKMTRPEMIIGLEKAIAFVTDEGGMLSHAAIVSREMKKPCVVGTKIATLVFKNGDLIEIDANKGFIRKLS